MHGKRSNRKLDASKGNNRPEGKMNVQQKERQSHETLDWRNYGDDRAHRCRCNAGSHRTCHLVKGRAEERNKCCRSVAHR